MSYSQVKYILFAAAAVLTVAGCAEPYPYQTGYPNPSYPSYPGTEVSRYGYVESIETLTPEPSTAPAVGVGAIGGAVVGGLIGHQFGHGSGNTAATIGGAVIGGVAGQQVEQHVRAREVAGVEYVFRVRMDDGSYQTFRKEVHNGIQVGDRVKVERGNIFRV